MIDIEAQITGDLVSKLNDAVKALHTFTPLLESIGKRVLISMRANILDQRSPTGERYEPLKRPRGKGHNPGSIALFDTGHLFNDGLAYQLMLPDAVAIGDSTRYGKYQNDGTKHIPARPFIGLRAEDVDAIRSEISHFVAAVFGSH